MNGGVHSAAAAVAHYHDQFYSQMARGVFDAAQFKISDDISRHPDGEYFADAHHEDFLRDDPGIGAGDDNGVRFLPIFMGKDSYFLGNISFPLSQ